MEMWPRLVDWSTFQKKYKPGAAPNEWSLEPEHAHPDRTGSMNVATVDAFQLMEAHLPDDVCKSLGTFIVSIASVEVEGWQREKIAPLAVKEHVVYAPQTVQSVLATFDSVDRERLANEVKIAWTKMSSDPKDWMYVDADYWDHTDSCGDFLDYLLGWRDAFEEAAERGYGLLIDAG